jgi:hypothetical protein
VLFIDITLGFAKPNVAFVTVMFLSGSAGLVLLLIPNLGDVKF